MKKQTFFKSKGLHYFRVIDPSNGEILAQSEGYHNKTECTDSYYKTTNRLVIQTIKNDLQLLINRISDVQAGRK